MNFTSPDFQKLMAEATRMTQGGNLQAATAAIQAALKGGAMPAPGAAADDPNVIDVEVREVGRDAPQADQPGQEAQEAQEAPPVQEARPAQPVKPGVAGQFITGSHTDAKAGMREYKLYIPPAAAADGQPLPLVVMLHGCTQNPDDFAAGTGMNEAAHQRGFYVLYPAQTQRANSSRCWNWFKHTHQKRGRGEPALLAGMTRSVMAHHAIDPQRVYVAGLSAGGAMAAILGDAYPDLFAAVGVHSGLATGAATDMPSAFGAMQNGGAAGARSTASPPTIVFHGDQDATVHPSNGEHVVAASAGVLKSEHQRERSRNGREYTRRTYRKADGRVVAEHWAVHGAGHAWSGGNAQGSYTDAQGPDATEEMLRFFLEKTLTAAR
ncbi:MAG: PHB depolymerase family esterase [Pseudomonadota bacterium]|nr:PHB depolymerase family esterase [Pseudomonadota bacterium]